jgi:hypothetical protein
MIIGGDDMSPWAVLGVAAAVCSCVDALPYIRDVLRGWTRPHRGTWGVWALLAVTAFTSQLVGGAGWSLLMLGIQAVSVTVVFVLSISRGVGGLGYAEAVLGAAALCGIAGWLASSRPVVATGCVVVADLAAFALMVPKAWRDPHSETAGTFLLAGLSGALAAAAVGTLRADLLLYPLYFSVVNTSAALVISLRQLVVPYVAAGPRMPRLLYITPTSAIYTSAESRT